MINKYTYYIYLLHHYIYSLLLSIIIMCSNCYIVLNLILFLVFDFK